MSEVPATKDFWDSKARKFATLVGRIYFYPTIIFLLLVFLCALFLDFWTLLIIMVHIGMLFFVCFVYILPLTYLFFIIQSLKYMSDKKPRLVISKKKTKDVVYFVFYVFSALIWLFFFCVFLVNVFTRGI